VTNRNQLLIISNNLKTASPLLNSDNPFDTIGVIHNELFEVYVTSNNSNNTLQEIAIEIIELINDNSALEKTSILINSAFTNQVQQILNYPENNLDTIILESGLSVASETRLNNLIALVSESTTIDYSETCADIISYEKEIIANVSLTPQEKEIILLVSAIVKYSLYDNGDRPDKDWDISVGNIVSIVYGAVLSPQDALLMGLTTKIFQNHQQTNQ